MFRRSRASSRRTACSRIIADFNKEGMTGAKDPGIGQPKWELYQELLKEGKLTVRMFALWAGARRLEDNAAVLARVNAQPAATGLARRRHALISGGVKMFMDGSGGARTAWMHEDWNKNFTEKDTGNVGYPATPPDVYRQIVTELHNAGIHVSTHAIGDRAIDWVVDTYAQALAAKPTRGLRHGIIHDNTPSDHAIDVMARLQREFDAGYPEAQADVHVVDRRQLRGQPRPRARAAAQRRSAPTSTRGIKWGGGSDYGVTPFPARYGLWASVARKTLNGTYGATPFGTDGVDRHQDGAALVHDLGRASIVSRRSHWIDRGRQGRRHRRVGSRPVHRPDRRSERSEVRADAVPRQGRLPGRRRAMNVEKGLRNASPHLHCARAGLRVARHVHTKRCSDRLETGCDLRARRGIGAARRHRLPAKRRSAAGDRLGARRPVASG